MNKKLIIVFICIFVALLIAFRFVIHPYIIRMQFNNNIVLFLNDNDNSSITNYTRWLRYAKSEKPKEYDVSGLINDYMNAIDLAIQKKINPDKIIRYDEYFKSGGLDVVAEHGIRDNWIEYIAKNVTEEDISAYRSNHFFDKLILEIEKVFLHKSNQRNKDWYINNDYDRIIELPYNVYYTFVCDHKKLKNEVDEIISIETREISKHYTMCKVRYKNNNGEIAEKEIKMFNDINMHTGEKTYFYSDFGDLYYADSNMPELTAGQHDYDIAKEKHWEDVWKDVEADGGFPGHTNEE